MRLIAGTDGKIMRSPAPASSPACTVHRAAVLLIGEHSQQTGRLCASLQADPLLTFHYILYHASPRAVSCLPYHTVCYARAFSSAAVGRDATVLVTTQLCQRHFECSRG